MAIRIRVLPGASVGLTIGEHIVEHLTPLMQHAKVLRQLTVLEAEVLVDSIPEKEEILDVVVFEKEEVPVVKEKVEQPAPKSEPVPAAVESNISDAIPALPTQIVMDPEPFVEAVPSVAPPVVRAPAVVATFSKVAKPEKPKQKNVKAPKVVMPVYQEMTVEKLKDILYAKKIKLDARNPLKRDMVAALVSAWEKAHSND